MRIQKPRWSTIAICIVLFIAFFIFAFPFQNLKGYIFNEIHKRTGIIIISDDLYLSFFGWPGLGMRNVDVSLPLGANEVDISCRKMIFRVGLGSLFPPVPSISLQLIGLKEGGDLYLKFSQGSEIIGATIEAEKVNLEQIEIPGLSDRIKGLVTADGEVDWNLNDPPKSRGYFTLDIDKLATPLKNFEWIVLPALDIGKVESQIQIQNGSISTNKFQIGTSSSNLSGSINGELKLNEAFMQSFLRLTLKLQLSKEYQNQPGNSLASNLKPFEISPGVYSMRWNASLVEMKQNPFSAMPQKATD